MTNIEPRNRIIWEECVSEKIKVKLPGVSELSLTACVRLVWSGGEYQIEVEAFNRRWVFSAFGEKCYSLIKVGVVEVDVCISGDEAAHQVKVLLQACVGLKVLGLNVEECFPLLSETVKYTKDKTEPASTELDAISIFNDNIRYLSELDVAVGVSELAPVSDMRALRSRLRKP